MSQEHKKDQFIDVPYHPGMRISFEQSGFEYTGTIKRVDRRRWAALEVEVENMDAQPRIPSPYWVSEAKVIEKLSA